jgi:hypothetical protein
LQSALAEVRGESSDNMKSALLWCNEVGSIITTLRRQFTLRVESRERQSESVPTRTATARVLFFSSWTAALAASMSSCRTITDRSCATPSNHPHAARRHPHPTHSGSASLPQSVPSQVCDWLLYGSHGPYGEGQPARSLGTHPHALQLRGGHRHDIRGVLLLLELRLLALEVFAAVIDLLHLRLLGRLACGALGLGVAEQGLVYLGGARHYAVRGPCGSGRGRRP